MKNRLLQGLCVLCAASALCFANVNIQASAAEDDELSRQFDPACVTVDYASQQLTVVEDSTWILSHGSQSDMELLFGVASVKKKRNSSTGQTDITLNTTSWDVYRFDEDATKTRKLSIDLSSLNRTKDNYIQIKGNTFNEPLTLKIPAVQRDLKVKYDKMDGTAILTNKKNQDPDIDSDTQFECRTQYGSWKAFDFSEPLTAYQQRGATIYIRMKALESVRLDNVDLVKTEGGILNLDGEELNVLSAGSFPGVELKLAVSKLANAPKVAVDYVKGTISIPKGCWYRIIKADDKSIADWREDAETSKITFNVYMDIDLKELMEKGGAIETYKPGTEKSPDSKIGHMDCNAKEDITARDSEGETTASLDMTVDGCQVVSLEYDEDEKKDVVSESFVNASLEKEASANRYTLVMSNESEDAYEVVVQASNNLPYPTTRPTKKIAAATDKKPTQEVKITKIQEGKYVFIRKAGNKKKGTWTTNYIPLGKIMLPDDEL